MMNKLRIIFLLFLMFGLQIFFVNCSQGSGSSNDGRQAEVPPVQNQDTLISKGNRMLGVDIVNETPASSFNQNVVLAQALGAEYFILDMTWKQVETGGTVNCNVGSYVDPGSQLAILNSVLPALNMKLTLNFSLSTTNIWGLPSIFSASTFTSDPNLSATQTWIDTMACRYANALGFVFSKIPDVKVISLQIGNEIDYLPEAQNANFWANYWRFLATTATYARTLRTSAITVSLPIGVTASLAGLTGGKGEIVRQGLGSLNQTINDFVSVNYYPFEAGGSLEKVNLISSNLNALISASASKSIHIQEFGCQSGTVSGSSTDLQKKCFEAMLKIWDANLNKITHVNLLRMNDLSYSSAYSTAASYSSPAAPDAVFVDYIQTLGLRTYDGTDKPSYTYLKEQLKLRSF
jgi:hypothetical protein